MTPTQKAAAAHAMILSKAWCDPAFKARLLANAPAALKRLGLSMRPGTTLKVVEDTESHIHLVLPPKPAGDLSQQALERMAADAGATWPAGMLVACAPTPVPAAPYRPVSRDVHVGA
jgi:hypothetical protein